MPAPGANLAVGNLNSMPQIAVPAKSRAESQTGSFHQLRPSSRIRPASTADDPMRKVAGARSQRGAVVSHLVSRGISRPLFALVVLP